MMLAAFTAMLFVPLGANCLAELIALIKEHKS